MISDVVVSVEIPSVTDYLALRKKAGLSARDELASQVGLNNSIYSVVLKDLNTQQLVGMGRIIGDGGTVYQLVDIAVDPDYQGFGLGKQIMTHLTTYIKECINPLAYINLIADGKASKLYQQFGFTAVQPESLGMYLKR